MAGIGIFGTLHIAKEGLYVQQSSVAVTAHNLANVNTPGYSRQSPVVETMDPQVIGGIYFGRGAALGTITKSYDAFLNNNIMLEMNLLGQWEIKESLLSQAETIFNESGDTGLNAMMNEFWQAWQDLADHPEGLGERAVLQQAGQTIASTFQRMAGDLDRIQSDANNNIVSVIDTINQLNEEIASLNNQIAGTLAGRGNANDLTDRRSYMVEQLSKLIDIRSLEQSNGQITVLTSFGKPLVAESRSWSLSAVAEEARGDLYSVYYNDGENTLDITENVAGGSLKGLLEIRDEIIPAYMDKMDTLASSLITEVNRMHYTGYGLDGSTGNYFFNPQAVVLQNGSDNNGGGKIYAGTITDPSALKTGTFQMTFVNSAAQPPRYAIYDAASEEYVYRIDAGNSTLVFDDSGTDKYAALTHGSYTGDELAAELESQLDAKAATGQDYTVTYDAVQRKFTITNKGSSSVDLLWDSAQSTIAETLGFSTAAADTISANGSGTSDTAAGTYYYASQLLEVRSGINDQILFNDGTAKTANLTQGVYTPAELAAEVETQLDANAAAGQDYTVTFDRFSQKFSITNNGAAALNLTWSSSSTTTLLGFDAVDEAVASGGTTISDTGRYAERRFEIIQDVNDSIIYSDGGITANVTATLTAGTYTGEALAAELEKQLETSGGSSGQDYIVTFDTRAGTFTVISALENRHSLNLQWSDAGSTARDILGFTAHADSGAAAPNKIVDASDATVGTVGTYDAVDFYGISTKLTDEDTPPQNGDLFTISTISDAARTMSMDPVTVTDPEKIAAALDTFDIDGSNNVIVFDDDGTAGGATYRVTIPTGRYTADELSAEIKRQLQENGESTFVITTGSNDQVQFDDGAGGVLTATLTGTAAGQRYTGAELAAEIEAQLEAASGVATFTVTFDESTRQFTVQVDSTNGGNATLNWNTSTAAATLGFSPVATAGLAAGGTDTSDVMMFNSYNVGYDSTAGTFTIANNPGNPGDLYLFWENPLTTAGFILGYDAEIFNIESGVNDDIDFAEGTDSFTATLTAGRYTGDSLAAEIERQLEAEGSGNYTVTYDADTRGFTITNNAENTDALSLSWSTSGAAAGLGFDAVDTLNIAIGSADTSDFVPGGIAAGSTAVSDFTTGGAQVGDNRNALDLATLKDLTAMEQSTMTFGSFYSIFVGEVGSDVKETTTALTHENFMIEQFEQRRQSIAGVSLDEEMVNLIKYQQAYAASAKMISALDEMLNQLLSVR